MSPSLTTPVQAVGATLQLADKALLLSRPLVMGILNLTPDSFADGGKFNNKEAALARAEQMLNEGVDIIDIGAESSRPYAQKISLQEEIDRLMEVLAAIKQRLDIPLSVDTYKPEVMKEAICQGAHLINDIYGLRMPGALETIAASNVAVCLMHMQNSPDTMQTDPVYEDVVLEVRSFLDQRTRQCLEAGIAKNRIILDPGFGFGKTTQHNLNLLNNLSVLTSDYPILVGLSRKFSIGEILAKPVDDRLFGSIAAHVIAVLKGATLIRAHDIAPTVDALKVATALLSQEA